MGSINVEMTDEARAKFLEMNDEFKKKLDEAVKNLGTTDMEVTAETVERIKQEAVRMVKDHLNRSIDRDMPYPHKIISAELNEDNTGLNLTIEVPEPLLKITIPKEELEKWKPQMEKLLKGLDDEDAK
jgi:uncharacterized protein YdcH (DUF465 family)